MSNQVKIGVRDVLVSAGLFLLALLGDSVNRSVSEDLPEGLPITDVLLLGAVTLPLVWRRVWPLTVLSLVTAAFLVARIAEVPEATILSITLFVALFAAGAYSHHPARDALRWTSILLSMATLFYFLFSGVEELPGDVVLFQVFSLLMNVAFFMAGWMMGDLWRRRAADQEELARRAHELEQQRDLLARKAVADERLRIARELHDIVGHHVSVMGVQAGAARRTLGSDEEATRQILTSIEESGRSAVGEMGRLVGFLRGPNDDVIGPLPTMAGLDDLVETMTDAGLEVTVHRVGRPRILDSTTDLSVYRVIQESLTNALRHGARPEAVLEISFLTEHLSVRVRNPAAANGNGVSGRGLVGMQERAGLVGGSVRAGRATDGAFEVLGTFPYRSET